MSDKDCVFYMGYGIRCIRLTLYGEPFNEWYITGKGPLSSGYRTFKTPGGAMNWMDSVNNPHPKGQRDE